MKQLSKSKYAKYCQCPKCLWMSVYKPEEEVIDPNSEARFENGTEVGDLAMGLLGDYIDVTTYKDDDRLDLAAMITKTKELMDAGQVNICEASFSYDGNYCAVDILHKTEDGWAIYEVKSTSFPEFNGNPAKLDKYLPDVAYQKWVLEKCGVNVTGTFLVCLNSDYVREGELDLQKLFVINDMGELIANEYDKVENVLQRNCCNRRKSQRWISGKGARNHMIVHSISIVLAIYHRHLCLTSTGCASLTN